MQYKCGNFWDTQYPKIPESAIDRKIHTECPKIYRKAVLHLLMYNQPQDTKCSKICRKSVRHLFMYNQPQDTECPKMCRKSVQHLFMYNANLYRCSTNAIFWDTR